MVYLLFYLFIVIIVVFYIISVAHGLNDNDEPYPSLSDVHDYEPNLEFDDTELHQPPDADTGMFIYLFCLR